MNVTRAARKMINSYSLQRGAVTPDGSRPLFFRKDADK